MSDSTTPVILSAVRTPIGRYLGGLSSFTAPQLGAMVIREAVRRAGSTPVRSRKSSWARWSRAASGQAPARQALIHAGLPAVVPALTINKVCGSGLKAVMLAAQAIKAGDAECIVAGGQEAMSSAPHYVYGMRNGIKAGNQTMVDGMIHDGLWDSFGCCHMGEYAEYTAEKAGVSRADQDAFAYESHRKARGRDRGREVQGRDPAGAGAGEGRPDHRRGRRVAPARTPAPRRWPSSSPPSARTAGR